MSKVAETHFKAILGTLMLFEGIIKGTLRYAKFREIAVFTRVSEDAFLCIYMHSGS
jgi:hypothetical protein